MKKTNTSIVLLFLFFSSMLKAQPKQAAITFWDWIVTPYNMSVDQSYNLMIDVVHSSPATRPKILRGIDELDKKTQDALKAYAALPTDLLPEYEKLKKGATFAIKAMRYIFDFDNMRAKESVIASTLTSKEVLQRLKDNEIINKRLDSITQIFHKDMDAYVQSNKLTISKGSDTANINEKKKVSEIMDYSSEIYKIYLETVIPFEDYLKLINFGDTTALKKVRQELRLVVDAKMKQLDLKKATKSADVLFQDMQQILKTMKSFADAPCDKLMKLLTTPEQAQSQQMVEDYNGVLKEIQSVYLPTVNGFHQKYTQYRQNNIKPRKTVYEVVKE
jgi:hypothetical protein